MASEAQRLIGISLTKIAQSRAHRSGVSLHKNLLVATVLQKARYIFMEEAYNMVHYNHHHHHQQLQFEKRESVVIVETSNANETADDNSVANLTDETVNNKESEPSCLTCVVNNKNKENRPPCDESAVAFDSDKSAKKSSLKRRRAVSEWETEEAVQSILPKRRHTEESDDNVFLDDNSIDDTKDTNPTSGSVLSENLARDLKNERLTDGLNDFVNPSSTMEIDRITSLVSIFSFGVGHGEGKLARSVSTPDLCSSQAKEVGETLQQRQFLAMTV